MSAQSTLSGEDGVHVEEILIHEIQYDKCYSIRYIFVLYILYVIEQ